MNTNLIPTPHDTPAGPLPQRLGSPQASRALSSRAHRRDLDALAARAELSHATDQARAFLASSAMNNLAALTTLAEHCYHTAPAAAPYYDAIITAYGASTARHITEF